MDPKARAVTEGFPTDVTFVGLLPGVDPFVDSETRAVPEGLPTLATFVGLLPSVDPLMLV